MRLIYILVIVISVLTVLSALALLFGSSGKHRAKCLWFLASTIAEVVWACSIAIFLSLGTGEADQAIAPWLIKGIYVGAIFMDTFILGYVSWKYKYGKVFTLLFLGTGIVLSTVLLYDPSVLYSSIILSHTGNSIAIDTNKWFFMAYIIYFCAIVPSFCFALIHKIKNDRDKKTRNGYLFFMIGLAVSGFLSLIFDLIITPTRYDLIWVGPMSIGLVILGFYYAILKYKIISISTKWLRILSYVIIITGVVICYLLIFHLVFSALFKISNPSFQVLLLNFVMVVIVLLLTPAISEMNSMTKSLIFTKQINLSYIVKKLAAYNRRKVDLKEISGFLAEYMHFSFVGFLVNNKFYGSDDLRLSADALSNIASLKRPEHGIWQDASKLKIDDGLELFKVGLLTDVSGETVGQVVLGKPISKAKLDKKDLAEVEMVFNLITVMVENGSRNT